MSISSNLSLPFLEAGQAQKHVTHNEALRLLDSVVQLAVVAVTASPPAEPEEGERHIVAPDATGAFDGHDLKIAAWQDGAWNFLVPRPGWRTWNADEEALLVWTGSAWSEISGGEGGEGDVIGPDGGVADGEVAVFDGATGKAIKKARGAIDYLGVGAPPDTTDTDTSNRLIVKASRVLFHARTEAETPGTGDIKLQISKEAEGDSASFFFSTNFSGRAEFGLVESDEFKLKVSEDGSAWLEAMTVDPATGAVEFPLGADLGTAKASAADFRANTADKVLVTEEVWSAAGLVALSDGATIAVDMATGFNFSVTLGGNRTLGAPSNTKVGQSGAIVVGASGSTRTLALNAAWKANAGLSFPVSIPTSDKAIIFYWVEDSTHIRITGLWTEAA